MKKIWIIVLLSLFMNVHVIYAETSVGDQAYEAYEKGEKLYQGKEYDEALKWLLISYEIEEDANVANNIGLVYKANKDYQEAINWYKTAFKDGNIAGASNLGNIYANNLYKKKDAIEWYQRAIEKGDVNARKNLGLFYHKENDSLNSAIYMMGMIGHPYTRERVIGLLRNDWKIDEKTLQKAYILQKKLIPNPYLDPEFEVQAPAPHKNKRGRR